MLTVAKSAFTHVSIIYEDNDSLHTSDVGKPHYENSPKTIIHGIKAVPYKKWHAGIDFAEVLDKDTLAVLEQSRPGMGIVFTEMVRVVKRQPVDVNRNTLQFMWLKPEFKVHNNLNKREFAAEQVRGANLPEDRLTMRFYSGNVTL